MSAFRKFDLNLIPASASGEGAAKVAKAANPGRFLATLATLAGRARADAEDWRTLYEERAAIAEHDGGLSRADAEQQAFECCVVEWLWQHPPPASGPERCAHCGEPLGEPGRDGLPFLTGDGGHTWLHSCCWSDWYGHRREEAVHALAAMGTTSICQEGRTASEGHVA